MKPWIAGWICLLLYGVGTGAAVASPADTVVEPPLRVVVSTHPLARLLRSVSTPEQVQVDTLLAAGVTPHDAVLRPRQLMQLVEADLVVWMGADIEPYLALWMRKRQGPVVDISTREGLQRLPARKLSAQEHGHTHGTPFDIHLWWSRHNLQLAGNAIAEGLISARPALRHEVAEAQQHFLQDMALLAREYAPGTAQIPVFAVFHDGWQYLERDLGQASAGGFVLDGELSMGVRHLTALKQRFNTSPVKCVLLEPGMNSALVDKLLPGIPTVTLDPLGWDAPGENATAMLRHAYTRLQRCAEK